MARYQTMTLQPPALPQVPPYGILAIRTAWRLAIPRRSIGMVTSVVPSGVHRSPRKVRRGRIATNRHLPRDNVPRRLHAPSMRWVLMLFVILAAVMGGEARAVVVMGRAEVSERVGRAEMLERASEATRLGGRAGA